MLSRSEANTIRGIFVWFLFYLAGCTGADSKIPSSQVGGTQGDGQLEAMAEGEQEFLEIKAKFAKIIEDASAQYHPIVYRFDEDLLAKMDKAEARLKDGTAKVDPDSVPARLVPEIDAGEEDDHIRQSIQRWSEKTGKDFRSEIDQLKAELAAVDKTKAFHPEFHKKFSAVFDAFIPIEVLEMRERRNRAIHRGVRALLEPYRTERPGTVEYFERQISDPPYRDPDASPR